MKKKNKKKNKKTEPNSAFIQQNGDPSSSSEKWSVMAHSLGLRASRPSRLDDSYKLPLAFHDLFVPTARNKHPRNKPGFNE